MTTGEKLRSLRQKLNMTVREVAEQAGVSYSTVSRYENDLTITELPPLRRLAQYYGVTLGCLLDEQETQTRKERIESINAIEREITSLLGELRGIVWGLETREDE